MVMIASRHRGFTIVELLIVVVVIAILASISIVAYTGIQDRAYLAKAASIVDGYSKIAEMYRIDNGSYYPVNGAYACLGAAGNFAAATPFGAGECYRDGGYAEGIDVGFNNALAAYSSQLPSGLLPTVSDDGEYFRGVQYWSNGDWVMLMYVVKGSQSCPRGEATPGTDDRGTAFTECEVYLGETP